MGNFFSKSEPPSRAGNIVFVSLGMAVLDELHFPDGRVLHDVAGGSGLYSTLGARMGTIGAAHSKRVACFILAGRDFPKSVAEAFRTWNMSLVIDKDDSRLSTRSILRYEGENFKKRIFKYITPPLQPTPADLKRSGLILSNTFHLLASPDLLDKFVSQIIEMRADGSEKIPRPLLVWEPAPPSCTPGERDAHLKSMKLVDIYSPNHKEFLSTFLGLSTGNASAPEFDRATIEKEALRILESGVGSNGDGVVVIRSGEYGCLVVSQSYPARWFPAFHDDSARVVDATGAGNTFLGGFATSFSETKDLTEATIAGSIAASFAIEQIGMPHLEYVSGSDGTEVWNRIEFSSRVEKYRSMLT